MSLQRSSERDTISYFRKLHFLAAFAYPLWILPYVLFLDKVHDDLVGRCFIGLLSFIIFVASFKVKKFYEQREIWFFIVPAALTIHYFTLVYKNNLHPAYASGAYIAVGASFVTVISIWQLRLYCLIVTLLASGLLYVTYSNHFSKIFFIGILTNLLVAYISQVGRLRITERLRSSEERLKDAQSIARLGSWEMDFLSNEVYFSEEVYQLLDLDPKKDPPSLESYFKSLHPDELTIAKENFSETIKSGVQNKVERRILTKTGEIRHLTIWTKPDKDSKGKVIRIKGVLLDISEIRKAEALAAQRQELLINSSKMAALGEMAGGIAHEINNPLAVIKLLSNQMFELVEKEKFNKDLLRKMIFQIEATTDRIAKIVVGLRTFSRDGSQDPFQKVIVHNLIEETLSFCHERFIKEGFKVIIDSFDKNLFFKGQMIQISQVLLNLLNNAHDAIETLNEKWIQISVSNGDNWIEIRITDSGNGIPEEVRNKIFQPFYTTKGIGKGTGMGLSISAGIIQSHKGELILDVANPNTSFVIRLPKGQSK